MRDFVNNYLSKFEISLAAWSILDMLSDKKSMTFNEIATNLFVDAPFITELAIELKAKHLIDISKSEDDKRIKVASLTIDGLRLAKKLNTGLTRNLTKFMEGCTGEDVDTYFKVIETIINNSKKFKPTE